MKYRTIIELVTEAEDKNEAMDIVGEFLNGGIDSGVRMKCQTVVFRRHKLLYAGIFFALTCMLLGTISFGYVKNAPGVFSNIKNTSAVQPPLKTSRKASFRDKWQEEETKKVLEYIKN